MLLQAAKARAEVVGQVENAGRHRAVLRAELLMHATELVEKLRQWHPKICKRYQEGGGSAFCSIFCFKVPVFLGKGARRRSAPPTLFWGGLGDCFMGPLF